MHICINRISWMGNIEYWSNKELSAETNYSFLFALSLLFTFI